MIRFQHGQLGRDGHYHGYSYGLAFASVRFFIGVMITMVVIGFPLLLLHGPLAVILEVLWVALMGLIALIVLSSKGQHSASRRQAEAVKPDEPVYDGDPPAGFVPPARPGGRSVGTKFQS